MARAPEELIQSCRATALNSFKFSRMHPNGLRRKVDERSYLCRAQLSFRVHQVNGQSSIFERTEHFDQIPGLECIGDLIGK